MTWSEKVELLEKVRSATTVEELKEVLVRLLDVAENHEDRIGDLRDDMREVKRQW